MENIFTIEKREDMLKDGYYLFIYSEINDVLNVLGHSLRHDQNMAVFMKKDNDVSLICHLEFERFSGIKHHNVAFYSREETINYLNRILKEYDLKLSDFVGIYGVPGLVENQDLSYSSLYDEKELSYHAISHLYTSMLLNTDNFYENDMISLAYDGGPDSLIDPEMMKKPLFCGAVSKKGKIKYFPISSPGGYWLYLSNYFNMPEGTLMALAYAANTKSLETFDTLPDYKDLKDKKKCIDAINNIVNRIMAYRKEDIGILYEDNDTRFSEYEIKVSMIMKVVQELSIQNIFAQLDQILKDYSLNPSNTILALSGGYALNCPTNSRIMKKSHFKELQCAPCVNDGGLSIGMGLYFFHKYCERFQYKFKNPYYGYTDENKFQVIEKQYAEFIESVQEGTEKAAADIEQEPVVWIDGRAEAGPRALGHRSILANPIKMEHKDLLNQYKKREWWRPVAPIVLEENVGDWFEDAYPSPYMLNNFDIKQKYEDKVPAVIHLDMSARVQTLKFVDEKRLYNVISDFNKLTGVPIICNTSLNDKGEPIINSVEQALNFALRKRINIVYAYGYRFVLKNHDKYEEDKCLTRDNDVFIQHKAERDKVMRKINPYNLPEMDLLIYLFNPSLRRYDITEKSDYQKVAAITKKLRSVDKDLSIFEDWAKNL